MCLFAVFIIYFIFHKLHAGPTKKKMTFYVLSIQNQLTWQTLGHYYSFKVC